MKTTVVADIVAPMLNDMMLPLSVINVIPTATQPMKDTVVKSERMLVVERNPGVEIANNTIAAMATH